MSVLYESIYKLVRQVPKGCVATYGQIARLSGNPRRARVVGYALSACCDKTVPCHRIVNIKGGLSDGFSPLGKTSHRLLLEAEGIGFLSSGCVDMERFCRKE